MKPAFSNVSILLLISISPVHFVSSAEEHVEDAPTLRIVNDASTSSQNTLNTTSLSPVSPLVRKWGTKTTGSDLLDGSGADESSTNSAIARPTTAAPALQMRRWGGPSQETEAAVDSSIEFLRNKSPRKLSASDVIAHARETVASEKLDGSGFSKDAFGNSFSGNMMDSGSSSFESVPAPPLRGHNNMSSKSGLLHLKSIPRSPTKKPRTRC